MTLRFVLDMACVYYTLVKPLWAALCYLWNLLYSYHCSYFYEVINRKPSAALENQFMSETTLNWRLQTYNSTSWFLPSIVFWICLVKRVWSYVMTLLHILLCVLLLIYMLSSHIVTKHLQGRLWIDCCSFIQLCLIWQTTLNQIQKALHMSFRICHQSSNLAAFLILF